MRSSRFAKSGLGIPYALFLLLFSPIVCSFILCVYKRTRSVYRAESGGIFYEPEYDRYTCVQLCAGGCDDLRLCTACISDCVYLSAQQYAA